jgi:spermidine/putrescine transport system substrate-binding protein
MNSLSRRGVLRAGIAVAVAGPALGRFGGGAAFAQSKQLNVYNYDTYIGKTTVKDFTKATGIKVRYDLYADSAELFAKLREGNPGYDIIVPTNDTIERLIRADRLVPIDHEKIPNFKNLDPGFQDAAFDPGRKFSIPYLWGTIGIGYRKSKVKRPPDSWAAIFAPDTPYKGRISILGEPSTLVQIALKYLGYSLLTNDMKQLAEARDLLIKAKPNFRTIAGDNGQELLASREVDLAMEWNGDILQVMAEDKDLAYALPKEGGLIWQDAMCIPKGAPNVDHAHAWINYILEPKVHAGIAKEVNYALPNEAARKLMPEGYRKNPAIYPPQDLLAKSETAKYLGEEVQRFYDETVTRLRAA